MLQNKKQHIINIKTYPGNPLDPRSFKIKFYSSLKLLSKSNRGQLAVTNGLIIFFLQ